MKLDITEMYCMGRTGFVVTDETPLLSWICTSDEQDDGQKAFQIKIWERCPDGSKKPVLDTGMIEDEQNNFLVDSFSLKPRTAYYWRVRVWSRSGMEEESREHCFETGKLDEAWQGKWIASTLCRRISEVKGAYWYKTGVTPREKVAKARLYVCGVGLYEAWIEGEKVSGGRLTPAYTKYDSRLYYDVWDVTKQAQKEQFGLGILVSNGRYNYIEQDAWDTGKASWRGIPRVIAELVLTYEDGTQDMVVTGESWRSIASPIVYECLRNGEHYDESLERTDFSAWDDTDEVWSDVRIMRGPGGILKASVIGPVVCAKEWEPVAVRQNSQGDWLVDFGQNFSGVVRLSCFVKAGETLKIRYAESLSQDEENVRTDYLSGFVRSGEFQTDWYTAAKDGRKNYEPRFVYHGFRYVSISGLTVPLEKEDIRGLELHTEFSREGHFQTSDEVLNGIWNMCYYSTASNFFGVPTDCSHREKNPWTGDAAVMSEQFLFTFGAVDCLEKWLDDIEDNQRPDGSVSCVIPSPGQDFGWGNGPDWSKAVPQILWNLYLYTGREDILRRHYTMLKRLVEWEHSLSVDEVPNFGIGDWCAPFEGPSLAVNMRNNRIPVPMTDTACYYYSALILERVEEVLGIEETKRCCVVKASDIAEAFRERFVDAQNGEVTGDCQTAYAIACHYHLCNAETEDVLFDKLVEKLEETSYHPDFGILGSECVFRALGERNRGDLLYRLAVCKGYPGYGHWLDLGYTTLGECWNGTGSRNHFMFSDIAAAMYRYLAGICPVDTAPGFHTIRLMPGGMPWITSMECRLFTPVGEIESSWVTEGETILWTVKIPFGCEASVCLPDGVTGIKGRLGSGCHHLLLALTKT